MKAKKTDESTEKTEVVRIPLHILESSLRREVYQEKLTCYIQYVHKILLEIDDYFRKDGATPSLLSPEAVNSANLNLTSREAFANLIVKSCYQWCNKMSLRSPISKLYLQFTGSLCSLLDPNNPLEPQPECPCNIPILRAASEVVAINDKVYQLVLTYVNLHASNLKRAEDKMVVLELLFDAKQQALMVFNDQIEIYEE